MLKKMICILKFFDLLREPYGLFIKDVLIYFTTKYRSNNIKYNSMKENSITSKK